VVALASAINELTHYTCKLRTSLWCALQIMLNLNENSANINQKSDLFYKLNDESNENNITQMKLLPTYDSFNRSASFIKDENLENLETDENSRLTEITYKNASII
jgi:hypothetical protein